MFAQSSAISINLSGLESGSSSDGDGSPSATPSPLAPTYSPISSIESTSAISEEVATDEDSETESALEETNGIEAQRRSGGESGGNWCGFKLVGDNIDKNIRPSYQRSDLQTKSLHHFHAYAVLDRVDLSEFSNITPERPKVDSSTLLPTTSDLHLLQRDAEILVSRYV